MLRLPCAFPFLSSQFSDPAIVASAFKSVVEEIKNLKISPPADDSRCVHCRKRRCVATYPACARNSYANERRQAVDERNVPVPAPPFPGVPQRTSLCSLAHRMNPALALFGTLSYPPLNYSPPHPFDVLQPSPRSLFNNSSIRGRDSAPGASVRFAAAGAQLSQRAKKSEPGDPVDFPPKGVGEMPKGTGQFVPWGKHIPRKKDVNYYVATGEQECKLCRRIVRNAEDVGRSMYSLCNGEYKELKDMCFAQQKVLQGCPEFANSTSSCGGERGASGGRAGGERGGVVGGRWYEWLLGVFVGARSAWFGFSG